MLNSLEKGRPFIAALFGYEADFNTSTSFHMTPVVNHKSDNVTVQLPRKLAEAILAKLSKGITEDALIDLISGANFITVPPPPPVAAAPPPPPPPPPPPLPALSLSKRLGRSSRVVIKVQNHRIPIELATEDLEKIKGTTTAAKKSSPKASFGLTLDDIRMGAKCLRKVKTSPGGTPVRVRRHDGNSPQSILARALMRKFRNVRSPDGGSSPCRRRCDFMQSAAAVMQSPSAFDEEDDDDEKEVPIKRFPVKKFDCSEAEEGEAAAVDSDDIEVSIPSENTPLLAAGTPQTPLKAFPTSPSKKRKTIC